MVVRRLQTSRKPVNCEICGRSLLNGEYATPFRDGPGRRLVCELCTERAFGKGWVREETTVHGGGSNPGTRIVPGPRGRLRGTWLRLGGAGASRRRA